MMIRISLKILCILLFLNISIFSQNETDWKIKSENRFLKILEAPSPSQLSSMKAELWTVQPGVTITTAFGHSALRIYFNNEFDSEDYYLEFGMYDTSLKFILSFLRGDALFKINVIPTEVAYNSWDASGRGVSSIILKLDDSQKQKLLKEILEVVQKNKDGYLYQNFKNNCVTYIRDILSNSLNYRFGYAYIEEERNTWRERVLPYSSSIIWLNISESLLFDKDTDIKRDDYELTYLPDDLAKSVEKSSFNQERKEILPHRWPPQSNNGRVLWIIIYLSILILSFPNQIFKQYDTIANKLYSLVSTIGGTYSLLVVTTTSFDFMNDSISYLIFNPIDIIFFKANHQIKNKKIFWLLYFFRVSLLIIAIILKFTIYPQSVGNILFLSCYFYICFFIKNFKRVEESIEK